LDAGLLHHGGMVTRQNLLSARRKFLQRFCTWRGKRRNDRGSRAFDGSDDRLTIHLGPRGPATLAFADGTQVEVKAEA
jgi:hypothetical protein